MVDHIDFFCFHKHRFYSRSRGLELMDIGRENIHLGLQYPHFSMSFFFGQDSFALKFQSSQLLDSSCLSM